MFVRHREKHTFIILKKKKQIQLFFGVRILFTFRAANHMQILLSRNDFVTRAHNKLICNGNK